MNFMFGNASYGYFSFLWLVVKLNTLKFNFSMLASIHVVASKYLEHDHKIYHKSNLTSKNIPEPMYAFQA